MASSTLLQTTINARNQALGSPLSLWATQHFCHSQVLPGQNLAHFFFFKTSSLDLVKKCCTDVVDGVLCALERLSGTSELQG
jgi:hypothetical protein